MKTPNVEVQETNDEVDQVDETEAYKNYFCFMADDEKQPSPLHQKVIENVNFMLHDNQLTVEPLLADIEHNSEIMKEYIVKAEYRVKYYKDELITTQFRFEELKCNMANIENDLEIKTEHM